MPYTDATAAQRRAYDALVQQARSGDELSRRMTPQNAAVVRELAREDLLRSCKRLLSSDRDSIVEATSAFKTERRVYEDVREYANDIVRSRIPGGGGKRNRPITSAAYERLQSRIEREAQIWMRGR